MTATPIGEQRTLEIIAVAARLLFANGQTTERIAVAVERLGRALGHPAAVFPRWGEIALRVETGPSAAFELIAVAPLGIDMGKVAAVSAVVDRLCAGELEPGQAYWALAAAGRTPAASTARFAAMAAAGAVALGVIFGSVHLVSLAIIGASAGLGGLLRRGLSRLSQNPFIQPFAAALLAGLVGGLADRLDLSTTARLIAVCPCMVLVPGPHLLNGAIDLARGRISLGVARLAYAGLIVGAICVGLLSGLALESVTLPAAAAAGHAPLAADILAAGVAVAAYGTFFSMPLRALPAPVVIGMLAHASRWLLLALADADAVASTFVACLLAGSLASLAADRLRLPFAGLGFASVVSLIPGVLLFRMAGGLAQLVMPTAPAQADLPTLVVADGAQAAFILLAMTVGLIAPRMLLGRLPKANRTR